MDWNAYRFRSIWRVDAAPRDTYTALEALEEYPYWWPEVREARRCTEDAFELRCRSLLPYDLDFVSRQARRDPEAGILEATLTGDLEGFSRWTIHTGLAKTVALFEEEVLANKSLLHKLRYIARPAFQANHALMMRNGQRGLNTYLAGYRFGRAQEAT